MAGALIFGVWNHFLVSGADHVNMIGPGYWQAPFRLTAVAVAVVEAAGTVTAVAVWVNLRRDVDTR
jgi:hypothetical protein